MTQHTLMLIKPNAVEQHHIGQIITIVEQHGFTIRNIRMFHFNDVLAHRFYNVHEGKPFFDRLIAFMTSGDTVALLLKKENAVEELRNLIGEVEPEKRKPGTIRYQFAEGVTENAVHASDTIENAAEEIRLIFG
ncbi:MAG: nucleoside-diphosphate kinase [Candidatus Cloacimonetes bacterium]|nr:nucleoside-diphosphate kinase [Candidatus Cloacimonadota bacterium]